MTIVDTVIAAARGELGRPYSYGADGPNAFDCSGLIEFAYAQGGISLPHNAAAQQKLTTLVSKPAPGDLVFYGNPATHVGLYVGGGKMIAAPHTGAKVQVQDVYGSPTYGRVKGSGAGLNGAADTLTSSVQTGLGSILGLTDLLGGVRRITIEALFAVLGAGLVGYGLYQATKRAGATA